MSENMETADFKRKLRREIRLQRNALSPVERADKGEAIRKRLLDFPAITNAKNVYSYICFQSEVPTRPIILSLMGQGKTIFTPARDFHSVPHNQVHRLNEVCVHKGDYVPVPCPAATPLSAIDVFLVPGMVWDKEGYRIGFGGGFFDRLLSEARPGAVFIGLAFDLQLVERVPRDSWDVPVHHILTETQWIQACNN